MQAESPRDLVIGFRPVQRPPGRCTSSQAWSWQVVVACSLFLLSPLRLQTAMAGELLPPIADERAGSEASEASSFSTPETTAPWPARPLMEGNWQDLTPEEFSEVMQKVRLYRAAPTRIWIRRNEWLGPVEPSRLRRLPLACYDNVALIEGEIVIPGQQPGVLTFLSHARGMTMLNGQRGVEQIRQLNKWNPPQLHTPEQAATYLKFMVGTADPGDGNVRVLEDAHSVDWKTDADRAAYADLEQVIHPLEMSKKDDSWIGTAIIQHHADLYRIELSLSQNGQPTLLDGQSLGTNLPIKMRRFFEWLRYDAW